MAADDWRFIPFRTGDRKLLLPAAVLLGVLVLIVLVFFVLNTPVTVDGSSMYPTLHNADRALVKRGYTSPRRGDVVSAEVGSGARKDAVIKRIVAIPGDAIEIVGDAAFVNGEPEGTGYDVVIDPANAEYRTLPFVVPEGHVFLLGDNRPVSDDSRFFGVVPLDQIQGRVVAIYAPIYRLALIDPGAAGP
ncbi:MAG: signal peptidase I [Coriobacteriia bacterium]